MPTAKPTVRHWRSFIMIKANDISKVGKMISSHMRKGVETNNFLTAEDYAAAVLKNGLFFEEWEDGIFILRKTKDFYKLNFHLNGFELYKERIHLVKKNSPVYDTDCENVSFCNEKYGEQAYKIMTDNFDKYSGCIPDYDEFYEDILNKRVIIFEKDSCAAGIIHFSLDSKSSEIRHLAVAASARGKGAAARMLKFYFENVEKAKYHLWTGADNFTAQKLYNDNGYERDGMISKVYILNRKEK